eukprot:6242429-Karenia_brevis.AAC.1
MLMFSMKTQRLGGGIRGMKMRGLNPAFSGRHSARPSGKREALEEKGGPILHRFSTLPALAPGGCSCNCSIWNARGLFYKNSARIRERRIKM